MRGRFEGTAALRDGEDVRVLFVPHARPLLLPRLAAALAARQVGLGGAVVVVPAAAAAQEERLAFSGRRVPALLLPARPGPGRRVGVLAGRRRCPQSACQSARAEC